MTSGAGNAYRFTAPSGHADTNGLLDPGDSATLCLPLPLLPRPHLHSFPMCPAPETHEASQGRWPARTGNTETVRLRGSSSCGVACASSEVTSVQRSTGRPATALGCPQGRVDVGNSRFLRRSLRVRVQARGRGRQAGGAGRGDDSGV